MKKIIALFLALGMLASLAACKDTANNLQVTTTTTAAVKQTTTNTTAASSKAPAKIPAKSTTTAAAQTAPPEEPEKLAPVPMQVLVGSHFKSEYDADTYQLLCSVEWNSILLDEESGADFPAMAKKLRQLAEDDFTYNEQIFSQMLPDAKAAAKDSDYFGGFTSNSAYLVQRADDRILSVRVNEDEYTGGVHPNYWVLGMNLDPTTGETLDLTSVMPDIEELSSILTKKLKEKYTYEPFDSLQDMLDAYTASDYTWTIDYQSITFYFSPYEIAPYAAGLLTATIRFDEMPELFDEAYTTAPTDGWAKPLPIHEEVEVKLNPDSDTADQLYISTEGDEYGYLSLSVTKNGQQSEIGRDIGYEVKPILVCLSEADQERYFLYVEATSDNDYTTLYVCDLNGNNVTLNGELSGAGLKGVWNEKMGEYGTWFEEVLNNPMECVLASTIYRLGTWTGYRTYNPHPITGMLLPQTEYYTLPDDVSPIVSAIDLEVTMLPKKEKVTVPAGTEFQIRRTDGDRYAELVLEDGRECRIEIVYDDYTPMINGVAEWDCFIDLPYAG